MFDAFLDVTRSIDSRNDVEDAELSPDVEFVVLLNGAGARRDIVVVVGAAADVIGGGALIWEIGSGAISASGGGETPPAAAAATPAEKNGIIGAATSPGLPALPEVGLGSAERPPRRVGLVPLPLPLPVGVTRGDPPWEALAGDGARALSSARFDCCCLTMF